MEQATSKADGRVQTKEWSSQRGTTNQEEGWSSFGEVGPSPAEEKTCQQQMQPDQKKFWLCSFVEEDGGRDDDNSKPHLACDQQCTDMPLSSPRG
jgi:hypothetical protein